MIVWLLACTPKFDLATGGLDGPLTLRTLADGQPLVLLSHQAACPVLQQYVPTLAPLPEAFPGAVFALVNGSVHDEPDTIRAELVEYGLEWPVFLDADQAILDHFDIHASAEALVLDQDLEVVYRGAVDDQIGYDGRKDAPSQRFLETALTQHLAGDTVDPAKTRSFGCVITRKKKD
ncbi:MAG: redoxin domain-containing protein [Proteobacteria bacterium]|nr:redoxin domain-containing protein [Pseudomonadota bacterium]MCP4921878.1 redoxin domain-containing protein [Pseudomonadota bacterium]